MAQFQCRCLLQDRWLRVLKDRLIFRRTTWSDSKDTKCRNCNSTGSLIHHQSWCEKQDSKHRSQVVLIFRRKLCYGSKKWRWLILWMSQNPHDQYVEKIFQNLRCLTRRLPRLSEQDHPEFPVQKEGQPRGAESRKRGPVSARETNRLHDSRLLSSRWCS